ncbi:uncharacterized protein LOC143214534 [Lasioglossum baleicum]|uniref:uncharacterized protein LOC143214534 n=1 Tax=Lasioglossum baleicum TaxID=434251 RepID=UPI003FCEE1CF
MKSDDADAHVKIEIQKTLFSIKQLTSNIKNELGVINEFVKQLGITVDSTNKTLTSVAVDMGLHVEEDASNGTDNEFHLNLRNSQNSAELQEKITAYLNNV